MRKKSKKMRSGLAEACVAVSQKSPTWSSQLEAGELTRLPGLAARGWRPVRSGGDIRSGSCASARAAANQRSFSKLMTRIRRTGPLAASVS
jgi:DNA gyrase inhibitor GyrI